MKILNATPRRARGHWSAAALALVMIVSALGTGSARSALAPAMEQSLSPQGSAGENASLSAVNGSAALNPPGQDVTASLYDGSSLVPAVEAAEHGLRVLQPGEAAPSDDAQTTNPRLETATGEAPNALAAEGENTALSPEPGEQGVDMGLSPEPEGSTAASTESANAPATEGAEEGAAISPLSLITTGVPADSVIVENYDDLTKALSEDNGYNKVYFANDIDGDGKEGIIIHPNKRDVLISGDDPRTDQVERYTYTEPKASGQDVSIHINYLGGDIGSVTFENTIINGYNGYGPCFVCDNPPIRDIKLIFRNVDYRGPSGAYISFGTVELDNYNFVHEVEGRTAKATEVVHGKGVTFKNKVDIEFRPNATSSVFWLVNGNAFTVEENAQVFIDIVGNGNGSTTSCLLYGQGPNTEIKAGASFVVHTDNELHKRSYNQYFNPLIVREGARFEVVQSGSSNSVATVNVRQELRVEKDATFIVRRTSASATQPALYLYVGPTVTIDDPALFIVGATRRAALTTSTNTPFSLAADVVNLWTNTPPHPPETGQIDNVPDIIWNKKDIQTPVTLNATLTWSSAPATGSVQHNIDPDADCWYTSATHPNGDKTGVGLPSETTLAFANVRQIMAGRHELSATGDYSTVTAITRPAANLRLDYATRTEQLHASADTGGNHTFSLAPGKMFPPASWVFLFARSDDVTAFHQFEIDDYGVRFEEAPPSVDFGTLCASVNPTLCTRVSPTNFGFSINDTRPLGGQWDVRVQAADHLKCSSDQLEQALVFATLDDVTGQYNYDPIPVGSGELRVASGTTTAPAIVPQQWDANQGLMLMLPAGKGMPGETYTTELVWSLYDTP